MVGFIYKYENKINHKVYIGQTTDLVNRKSSHRYKATFEKNKFYNAVRKYGWDNFDFDIVAQVEENDLAQLTTTLDTLEVEFIEKYDSFYNGYNSTTGGHSYRGKEVSEEFREYCRNRIYSEETKKKMSIATHNKVVSESTREKLRQNAIRNNFSKYRKLTTEKRNKGIREALGKPVLQIDKDGIIVNEFPTVKDAALFVNTFLAQDKKLSGIEHGIHRHCTNQTKKRFYYGFEWEFKPIV